MSRGIFRKNSFFFAHSFCSFRTLFEPSAIARVTRPNLNDIAGRIENPNRPMPTVVLNLKRHLLSFLLLLEMQGIQIPLSTGIIITLPHLRQGLSSDTLKTFGFILFLMQVLYYIYRQKSSLFSTKFHNKKKLFLDWRKSLHHKGLRQKTAGHFWIFVKPYLDGGYGWRRLVSPSHALPTSWPYHLFIVGHYCHGEINPTGGQAEP